MTPPAASNECRSANLLRPCSIIWQASASTNSCSPRSTHARAGLCRTWHSPRCCDAWAKEASPSMASARPFAIGAAKKLGVSEAAECAAPHSRTPNPGQPISETLRIAERQRNTIHEAAAVASVSTSPAAPTARLPRCTKCQSLAYPSVLEYWHMGETNTRFANVMSRIARGSNRRVLGCGLPF
jgi:hypothetical protein